MGQGGLIAVRSGFRNSPAQRGGSASRGPASSPSAVGHAVLCVCGIRDAVAHRYTHRFPVLWMVMAQRSPLPSSPCQPSLSPIPAISHAPVFCSPSFSRPPSPDCMDLGCPWVVAPPPGALGE
eukprot:7660748-Pyramimonas_sp.AAC.1